MAIEQGLPELKILHSKLFSRTRHFQALPGTVSFSDIRFRDYADEQRRLTLGERTSGGFQLEGFDLRLLSISCPQAVLVMDRIRF